MHKAGVEAESRDKPIFLPLRAPMPQVDLDIAIEWNHLVHGSVVDHSGLPCQLFLHKIVWVPEILIAIHLNLRINSEVSLYCWQVFYRHLLQKEPPWHGNTSLNQFLEIEDVADLARLSDPPAIIKPLPPIIYDGILRRIGEPTIEHVTAY